MKNVLIINAKNNCTCDLVSNVYNGTNTLFLEIHADTTKNPQLKIQPLLLESLLIDITENVFTYEVQSSYWTSKLQFEIIDDEHTSDKFTITLPTVIDSDLIVSQIDNFNYVGKCIQRKSNGLPIATPQKLGGIMVGSTLNINDDGLLNANDSGGVTPITNIWLEENLI